MPHQHRPPSALRAAAFALAFFAAPGSIAGADDPIVVRNVALTRVEGGTRLVVETDRAVSSPHGFFLQTPNRFVLDMPGARWARAGQGAGAGAGVAARYRYANRPEGAARLVLDLAGPAELTRRSAERGGRRLVFTFSGEAAEQLIPLASQRSAELSRLGPPQPERRTIVIDAGHGGRDPGAVGVNGVREEAVVLATALRLREALVARGYDVAMTRDGDRFIELEDRVRFAREHGADLFISLHADSAPGARANGAAVYTLSERGATRSRNLMDTQNWRVDTGAAPGNGIVQNILLDLTQRETTNRSSDFARMVLGELTDASVPIMHRTPRNAGFFVLLAPDVPAVLVEMGFLSNAQDEARLDDPRQQGRLARALADAVDAHFAAPRQMADR